MILILTVLLASLDEFLARRDTCVYRFGQLKHGWSKVGPLSAYIHPVVLPFTSSRSLAKQRCIVTLGRLIDPCLDEWWK